MLAGFIPFFCLNMTSTTHFFLRNKPRFSATCMEWDYLLPSTSSPQQFKAHSQASCPRSKMRNSSLKLFFLIFWVTGALSMPPSRPLLVGENASFFQRNLSRSPRTISSLNPAFLFEAVRGLANIFQGLSSFLFTGTSIFGLLNLFKPQAGAGGDVPGQLFGGGAFPGNQNLAGIGSGSLPGLFGTLSPKSNDSAWTSPLFKYLC